MAMLADPRQRKRYNLVPRGKALYEDTNRFGTKMLEKMGWSKGKGLGAREDGLKDFVRIRYKNDAEGFGYENRDDQWTEHEKHFSGLLNSLNNSANNSDSEQIGDHIESRPTGFGFQEKKKDEIKNTISGESLEEKSKNSKARVHYKKFTRGKDLTRYSEKDLANIFGKKSLNDNEPENTLEVFNKITQKSANDENKDSLIYGTFTSGTPLTDYFKEKMQRIKELKVTETNAAIKSCENSTSSGENVYNENEIIKKKQKKKRKHSEDEDSNQFEAEEKPAKKKKKTQLIDILESKVVSENTEEKTKTKKKNKKSQKEEGIISELLLKSVDEETAKIKKKKNKSHKDETIASELPLVDENSQEIIIKDEAVQYEDQEPIKKKSKKSKHKEIEEILPENMNASLEMDKKKKKKKKVEISETENANKIETCVEGFSNQLSSKELSSDISIKTVKTKKIESEMVQDGLEKCVDSLEKTEVNVSLNKSNNSFVISEFSAEKFRQTDLQAFCGSNVSDILGYGVVQPINLVIKHNSTDDKNIMYLWESATKIRDEVLNQKYDTPMHKYQKKVTEARRLMKKIPKINVKQFQKKSVFNLNI